MEYENIKELINDMGNSKLSSMDIEFSDGTKISMKKSLDIPKTVVVEKNSNEVETEVSNKDEHNSKIITSPMVGTFYLKPSPTSQPFVSVGDTITAGDTVCIIEAMKLMNEIESEYSGIVSEIYVEDGQAVEYGSKLFKID